MPLSRAVIAQICSPAGKTAELPAMRVAHLVLPGASEYEKKCQRVDFAALAARHEIVATTLDDIALSRADVAHVYASHELPASAFVHFPLPYVAPARLRRSRWSLRRPVEPAYVVSPVPADDHETVGEAVEERYFTYRPPVGGTRGSTKRIGSFDRASIRPMVEQTFARIERFRDDTSWSLFDAVPSPEELAAVDVWVDPALDDADFDGFVAEAIVAGVPVVASRTPINAQRLEKGRTGWLVPPGDPNEMTHAILAALFKPEVAESKREAARQTASKFNPRQRLRTLLALYEALVNRR